uniref:DUF834 domain-containing protein n=1 Tax=Oryza rufipogon TaxID=4529 RepID=A0A0E0P602_ORYRU
MRDVGWDQKQHLGDHRTTTLALTPLQNSFSRERERERRGAGAPVMERSRRRWPSVFPSDAHPGKVVASRGKEGDGRNGVDKTLVPAGLCGGGDELWRWLKERGKGRNGITSSRRSS